ncbi:GMC oxidoreductase [Nodosilinea sp. FACHB-13]|uniref:GMC oxidoreductase n=1 Tax=Cyanophyceae TaxID=3028117 RepID=UPI00168896ED|nr:GMC oxidoreductase [Nodosilinea sp. FACHB-13]MBD2107635.1 GMC family oxidoreductase N-terminal domain-containing protein [Nodosilinea sp. FACHB-13]
MTFTASTYANFVAAATPAQERLFLQYTGSRNDFDIIVVGSGIGGGLLADDLADRFGRQKRILVLEAGSFIYPTHTYNLCRFPNASVAKHFACDTFWQNGNSNSQNFIGEKPQLNFGGRSIFWSGLIPSVQEWELDFFPDRVRQALAGGLLNQAGELMNESRSMGATAQAIVTQLRRSPLALDFSIQETPRALHQPYLESDGTPKDQFFTEPTGVFNTAELLINEMGLTPGVRDSDGPGLHLLLNHFVEDIQQQGNQIVLVARNTLTGQVRVFNAGKVVLAAGSIESPKLLRRSSLYPSLPAETQALVGRGLTDHPTSSEITTFATGIGNVSLNSDHHAKIVLYSRGLRDANGQIRYPFNVEMNINHEYWHLRENDPTTSSAITPAGPARIDIKFSFGNCLDDANEVKPAPPFGYVPEVQFGNLSWADRLAESRFSALAGWNKSTPEIWAVLNQVTFQLFSQFNDNGQPARPVNEVWYGQGGKGFGWGTVHHAAGTLRMPYRPQFNAPFAANSVVDEDLRVNGTQGLYVCDMSVMPFSSAANPVRTLAALALRLSQHLG